MCTVKNSNKRGDYVGKFKPPPRKSEGDSGLAPILYCSPNGYDSQRTSNSLITIQSLLTRITILMSYNILVILKIIHVAQSSQIVKVWPH